MSSSWDAGNPVNVSDWRRQLHPPNRDGLGGCSEDWRLLGECGEGLLEVEELILIVRSLERGDSDTDSLVLQVQVSPQMSLDDVTDLLSSQVRLTLTLHTWWRFRNLVAGRLSSQIRLNRTYGPLLPQP